MDALFEGEIGLIFLCLGRLAAHVRGGYAAPAVVSGRQTALTPAGTHVAATGLSAQMRRRPALALRAWRSWLPAGRPGATAGLRRAARA